MPGRQDLPVVRAARAFPSVVRTYLLSSVVAVVGRALALALLALGPPGCAAPPTTSARVPWTTTLVGRDGAVAQLAAFRGRRILLFLFTTYDTASQLAIWPVAKVATEGAVQTVPVTVQPNAEELLSLYVDALGLTMPVYSDRDGVLLSGRSELGQLGPVPQYLLFAADGRLLARHHGVLLEPALRDFVSTR